MKTFRSEDVSATAISRSVNKRTNSDTTWRDVISTASTLGISHHENKWGTTCYTAYQAERIREAMCKLVLADQARAALERKANESSKSEALAQFSDQELADELRNRGWELVAERKKTIIENL